MGFIILMAVHIGLAIAVLVWRITDPDRVPMWIVPLMVVPFANLFFLFLLVTTPPRREDSAAAKPRKGVIYTPGELEQFKKRSLR